jgi:hypothetical protein
MRLARDSGLAREKPAWEPFVHSRWITYLPGFCREIHRKILNTPHKLPKN